MKIDVEKHEKIENFISLDNFLEILGNPTRRVILSKLAKVPHSTSELAKTLNISRQAVHSQLEILNNYNIIEKIGSEKRGSKYRIKSNLSLRIDISPDYYNVEYDTTEINDGTNAIKFKDISCSSDFKNIKSPNKKIRFLGEQIMDIEESIRELEKDRSTLLQNKQCMIVELKKIMENQYKNKLSKERPDLSNLIKEIFYTLFFNPEKYHQRININSLLEDMFFSDMDLIRRDQNIVSIKHLLRDLSKFMDFLYEEKDDWFFDI